MLKSFKSFKSFKGDSNVSFQILCKSTMILLYEYEEYVKKLLNLLICLLCLHLLSPCQLRTIHAQYTHNKRTINALFSTFTRAITVTHIRNKFSFPAQNLHYC